MKSGWYILNYHNVDWEDSILTRAVGVTTRPDVFRHQLGLMASKGRFISIPEGQALLDSGEPIREVLFSLWFDDGYSGLPHYAQPICRELGVVPALSINSRFAQRSEMFWRCKLAYLAYADGLRFVRAGLRKTHKGVPFKIRSWSMQHFSDTLRQVIDEVYERYSDETFRRDAFRIFADEQQLQRLADDGWLLANHTAGHWPLAPELGWELVERQFDECEELVRRYNPNNRYWVIPFAYGSEHYRDKLMARATVVEVGERRNTAESWRETGRIFRYDAPMQRNLLAALG